MYKIQYAAIHGTAGELWANSPDFIISAEEVVRLATALSTGEFTAITQGGFSIAGQQYTFTRGEANDDDGSPAYLQGRCKEDKKSSQGVLVFHTNKAVIIGVHDPSYSNGASFGKVNTDIGRLADYFLEQGF